jgi:16S rRNA processing protein RimM
MPDGTHRELRLEDHWPHKGQLVLKFVGIDSITAAETLVGCELQIPRSERVPLEAGAVYISDLVGCMVIDHSREVGAVTGLDASSGAAPNLVVRSGQKEFLIPFAEQYLRKVDLAAKCIEMELPQGLLELDVPLSPEEKQRQRG